MWASTYSAVTHRGARGGSMSHSIPFWHLESRWLSSLSATFRFIALLQNVGVRFLIKHSFFRDTWNENGPLNPIRLLISGRSPEFSDCVLRSACQPICNDF